MSKGEDHLEQWVRAGVLEEAAAERVRAFERARAATTAGERPGVMEVLVYLGIAVIAVGVFILVSISWEDLAGWARVAVTAGPGLFALLMGQVLRGTRNPGLVRGGQMAWLAGTALLAGSVAVFGANNDWAEENVVLGAAITGTVVALALWAVAPGHPQVVAIAAALLLLSLALGSRSDEFNPAVAGLSLAAFGAAGVALAERRLLTPLLSARPLAAAWFALGTFWAATEATVYEPLPFIAAAGLLALGIWRATFIYIIAGVALVFLSLIFTITQHIEEPSAQAAALIMLGALLVAVVLGLARWQPWKRTAA